MPRRYHPALVTLHWLLAVFLIGALVAGGVILEATPNSDPTKITSLAMHMSLGGVILVLMLVRLVVRLRTAHPAPADSGVPAFNRLAPLTHWALYAAAIAMAASGVALSVAAGLPPIVFGGQGSLPPDFDAYAARALHGFIAPVLMALIVLHVAAALWHQVIRRDGLMARMWFGPR
ncbi:MAG: cytochrome b [Gemmobacter sp.]